MNDLELNKLRTEIDTDELSRGYSGMTNQQIADSLNEINRNVITPFLSGVQIGQQLNLTEFNALSAEQRNTLRAMFSLSNIPTETGFYRDFLLSAFNAQSTTRTNLIANFTHLESRASEIGIPFCGAHHVETAKLLVIE